jgi:hypothetical protein
MLLHEMMHILEHPNFERTQDLIGGEAQEILKEGFADVMRRDLWDGPGNLSGRLSTSALSSLRALVEAGSYPYSAAVIQYHPDYRVKYPKARDIVFGHPPNPGVGIENAKAAFFLGHTELLGLGAGTATVGGVSLAATGMYTSTESAEAEIIVSVAGDTVATVQARTNAPAGRVLNAATGAAVAPGPLAPGTRLRVPGIRWVYALGEDTLGSIANQHAMSIQELSRANGLPALTPETHRFPVGTRVLIPIHLPRP